MVGTTEVTSGYKTEIVIDSKISNAVLKEANVPVTPLGLGFIEIGLFFGFPF